MFHGSLRITSAVMQNVVRLCRIHSPQETCGFIVASPQTRLGTRVVWMQNVHEKPGHHYRMDDEAVRLAYAEFDQTGEEPIAVFHSHPASAPLMSDEDRKMALDESLAYVVVSLAERTPKVRAYTVQQFVGNSIVTPVAIEITRSVDDSAAVAIPPVPWALMIGNRVRIQYQRTGKTALSTTLATITGSMDGVVHLDPAHKTAARMIPIERIRCVHVIRESSTAAAVRRQLQQHAAQTRLILADTDVAGLPTLIEALRVAFPSDIAISMDQP